jgi:methyltransferase (TIGR00027 family)
LEHIQNISDTAFWIAAYRALETERPDAAFQDELAAKLAGEIGPKIVAETPHTHAMAFAMTMRTAAIDKLVLHAVEKGVDTIINLAAGLDTRPYRLALPAGLRWVEADLPDLISYKNEMLKDNKPVCRFERVSIDLSGREKRLALFKELNDSSSSALIITEGLIGYLTNEEAASLAEDLHQFPSFRYWIMDYSQGRLQRNKHTKDLTKSLKRTPIKFRSAKPIQFFGEHGWSIEENIFILDQAKEIGRAFPAMFPWSLLFKLLPGIFRKMGNKTFGYVMFRQS